MKAIFFMILLLALFSTYAFSDMGAIVPDENIDLTEPAQRAIIAHDGFEEILILSTDFDTSKSTKIVRFIPFPSEAKISQPEVNPFSNLKNIIEKYDLVYLKFYKGGTEEEGIEVIGEQILGPHKIIQVKVSDFFSFSDWVRKLFKEEGIDKEGFTQKEEEIVTYYLQRGINYFVFDIIDLGDGINPILPLVYRFKTRYFYYPLVTSSLFPGEGTIELFVISKRGAQLEKLTRFPMPHPWKRSNTAVITWEDMTTLSPEIAHLMGAHAIIEAFKYKGSFNIKNDIWFKIPIYEVKPYNPIKEKKR